MAVFEATNKYISLDFEHWTLVCLRETGELAISIKQSLWQTAFIAADIEQLKKAMANAMNEIIDGPQLVPMTEEGFCKISAPADRLVREWREEWFWIY